MDTEFQNMLTYVANKEDVAIINLAHEFSIDVVLNAWNQNLLSVVGEDTNMFCEKTAIITQKGIDTIIGEVCNKIDNQTIRVLLALGNRKETRVDFFAATLGMSKQRLSKIVSQLCNLGLAQKNVMHFSKEETKVFGVTSRTLYQSTPLGALTAVFIDENTITV